MIKETTKDIFEISKETLRKYLSENKEKVITDLKDMRKKSNGDDINEYINNL